MASPSYMTEPGERVAATCPTCSPERPTVHEVLSDGGTATVRCLDCGQVHSTSLGGAPTHREVRTVISQAGESTVTSVPIPAEATLEVGDEFVAEADEATYAVEITSLEGVDDDRHERLTAAETATIWTRDVGNVAVDVTIHPPERVEQDSRSTTMWVAGDRAFEVGDEETIDGEPVRVHAIVRRDDGGTGGRTLDARGARVLARNVTRLYVRSRRQVPRSPW